MRAPRVLAFDPGLAQMGVAGYDPADSQPWTATVTIKHKPKVDDWLARARTHAEALVHYARVVLPDIIVGEALPGGISQTGYLARVGLLAIIADRLDLRGYPPILWVHESKPKIYALGIAGDKAGVREAVQQRYGIPCPTLDEGDAFALLALTYQAYGYPLSPMPASHVRGVLDVPWPTLPGVASYVAPNVPKSLPRKTKAKVQ